MIALAYKAHKQGTPHSDIRFFDMQKNVTEFAKRDHNAIQYNINTILPYWHIILTYNIDTMQCWSILAYNIDTMQYVEAAG